MLDHSKSNRLSTLTSVLLVLATCAVHAEGPSPSQFVIVTAPKSEVFAKDEPIGAVPPGSIIYYSKVHGSWLMVPRYQGWVNQADVVAVEKGEEFFTKLSDKEPSPETFHHRGIVRLHMGKPADALADFNKSIELGNKTPAVYINRGNAKQRVNEHAAAVVDYTEAIRLNANNPQAYDNRATALAALKQFPESLADSNKALELLPKYPEALNNRGVTRQMLGEHEAALADFNSAVALFPRYAAAYANRAFSLLKLQQADKALADYRMALEFDKHSPGISNDLAWLLATTKEPTLRNPKEALELAETAVKATQRKDPHYLDTLAAALAASGKFPEAVQVGEEAAKGFSEDPEAAKKSAERVELYRKEQAIEE